MNRRHLLTMGGAGVAALALPSFLPGRNAALAQGHSHRMDPMLAELTSQLRNAYTDLTSPKPKVDARHIAALFRMQAAWMEKNNVTAHVKRMLADEKAEANNRNPFVIQHASFDRVADARAHQLVVPPSFNNLTPEDVGRGVALLSGGWTYENAWRLFAAALNARADQINQALRGGDSLFLSRVRLPAPQLNTTGSGCTETQETVYVGGPDGEPSYVTTTFYHCHIVADGNNIVSTGPMTAEDCRIMKINVAAVNLNTGLICLVFPEYCIGALITLFISEALEGWYCG